MKDFELFLRKEFINWLNANSNFSSGSSYASYVASFLKNYSSQVIEEPQFEALIDNGSIEDLEDVFANIYTIIHNEKANPNALMSVKDLRDSASALKKYHLFLGEQILDSAQADSLVDPTEVSAEDVISEPLIPLHKVKEVVLESDYIITNFTHRLMTQDRYYGDVFFPISIIKKLALKNGLRSEFDNWLNDHLNKIQFHTDKGTLSLPEISALKIENNGQVVLVCNDGNSRDLLTKYALNGGVTPMYVSAFKDVVIDHVVSMKEILSNNKDNLPALASLTNELKGIWKKDFLKRNDLRETGNKLLSSRTFNSDEILNLLNDLNFISKKTDLQLMERKQNSMKRAN